MGSGGSGGEGREGGESVNYSAGSFMAAGNGSACPSACRRKVSISFLLACGYTPTFLYF